MKQRTKTMAVFAALLCCGALHAQRADQAWLRYLPAPGTVVDVDYHLIRPQMLGKSELEYTASGEITGFRQYDRNARSINRSNTYIVIGTKAEFHKTYPSISIPEDVGAEGYWIGHAVDHDKKLIVIAGGSDRGVLYGSFALIRLLAQGKSLPDSGIEENPAFNIRWTDEWDNADGTIERGYGGPGIFFDNGKVCQNTAPMMEYARLLSSVGVNAVNLNNVNNADLFLTPEMLAGVARIADAMRPWGVRVALSVDVASPQKIGGLSTFDPLDHTVKKWWAAKTDEIYKLIPDFAGFTVKADSEGQPGPASYGRTPADAANMLAAALAPHGGIVLYRAFVYNHHLDWRDPKADRARAAYDIFHPLDGKFAMNVVVQIKPGPIDFQVREPVSPLFAGLQQTSEAMEVQITQEYLGQQRHLVYKAPWWHEVLDFDLHADNKSTPVKEILEGKSFYRPLGGMVGVSNIGRDWLGSPLAMANLYAYGRQAWNPNLAPDQIAQEWVRLTIGNDPQVVETVTKMLMQSWPAYEDYTGPLGLQTLTDITGSHYGPNIESSERNGWGQWHRADHEGVGMDRSVATGTGFAGQYPPALAQIYESAATTPDNLLLFFHHVPYTYKLRNGETVIQYIYDSHYRGAARAALFVRDWESLKSRVDPALYADVLKRLDYQAGHAIVWRDAVTQYFLKMSGIPDDKGRAGHYPGRYEAEDARLNGYTIIDVNPWEDASRGKAVSCEGQAKCSAEWTYNGPAGRFNIATQYFDLNQGVAHFTLALNGRQLISWAADAHLPTPHPHGDNSTRYIYSGPDSRGILLKPGDTLRIDGAPDAKDPAALDYIEILQAQ